jgi:hypothetical protein
MSAPTDATIAGWPANEGEQGFDKIDRTSVTAR